MRAGVVGIACGIALASCSTTERERCEQAVDKIESCGRSYDQDVCATKADRCSVGCYGRLSCDELDELDRGDSWPPELGICLSRCQERIACKDDGHEILKRWRCDGENDCVDGSDERRCEYFACGQDWVVSMDSRCDEWPDCPDRSDEDERCGYFLCRNNAQTIGLSQRCDEASHCDDGSDEVDCP